MLLGSRECDGEFEGEYITIRRLCISGGPIQIQEGKYGFRRANTDS